MIDILDNMLRLVDELEREAKIFIYKMKEYEQQENEDL